MREAAKHFSNCRDELVAIGLQSALSDVIKAREAGRVIRKKTNGAAISFVGCSAGVSIIPKSSFIKDVGQICAAALDCGLAKRMARACVRRGRISIMPIPKELAWIADGRTG